MHMQSYPLTVVSVGSIDRACQSRCASVDLMQTSLSARRCSGRLLLAIGVLEGMGKSVMDLLVLKEVVDIHRVGGLLPIVSFNVLLVALASAESEGVCFRTSCIILNWSFANYKHLSATLFSEDTGRPQTCNSSISR